MPIILLDKTDNEVRSLCFLGIFILKEIFNIVIVQIIKPAQTLYDMVDAVIAPSASFAIHNSKNGWPDL